MPPTEVERLATAEAAIGELREDVRGIKHDIREMRNDLAGRPSWAVSVIITILSSTVCGLAVALVTQV